MRENKERNRKLYLKWAYNKLSYRELEKLFGIDHAAIYRIIERERKRDRNVDGMGAVDK